jgi:CRP/FNR family transcriptional regulator
MTPADLERALRALPHFKSLPPDLLSQVAALTKRSRHDIGELLFSEGDRCRAFFAIESGGVKLYRASPDGHEQVVHNLHSGATFAEAALLSFGRFPVNALVSEPSTILLEIGGEEFLRLFREDVRLSSAMVASLSMRLISLVERVEELSLVQAGSRLARWLLRQPATGAKQPSIELALAKKDLAAHLAMTPETLSRLLSRWQADGWIESGRAQVVILQSERLSELADGISAST